VFDGDGYHLRDGGTLGTLAFLSSVNGGNWSGTDLAVVDGGTGASTAAGARTNLGLVIGTDVQAYDATLTSIAALGSAADKLAYTTGVDTWAEAAFTTFGRTVVATMRTQRPLRTAAGLVIGTDVQAYDGELAAIAGLTSAADKFPYFTGSGTAALADVTSFIRTLLDDASASAARTTLGIGLAVAGGADGFLSGHGQIEARRHRLRRDRELVRRDAPQPGEPYRDADGLDDQRFHRSVAGRDRRAPRRQRRH
jgi:hypothetical protein